jgi:type II secretory ATPase GspE/PulE/Tfp pilus assembly ATPase PilB-like protein/nucleoid DNA-binding protein
VTQQDVCNTIAEAAALSNAQAGTLVQATFEIIARELSVGEKIEVEGLGSFEVVKYPSESVEDPPGSGNTVITLPTLEPEFNPDEKLVELVLGAQKKYPELFEDEEKDEKYEEEEDVRISTPISLSDEEELPDMPSDEEEKETPEPNKEPESAASDIPKEKPLGRASTIQFMEVGHLKIEHDILSLIPYNLAKQYSVAPIELNEGQLTVAMIDPEDFDALQTVQKETGLSVKSVLTTKDDLNAILDQYTGLQAELQEVIEHAGDMGLSKKDIDEASEEDLQDQTNENAPTAKIVFSLLKRAVKERASDVHIEPYDTKVMVRFRIDGVLTPRVELPKSIQSAVISRLKILSNLKIDEQRLPQDGRFNLIVEHRQVDFRLSTIPVVYGEKVVMRILDKSVGIISLEQVGLSDHGLEVLLKNMQKSHGMILVTGPTGSGKTTSLYAVLGKMMSETVNILTLEDPVEYRIESINQSQMHADIGYNFASGLRAAVRQDPDIVMLGEIRDQETADMAIHAALTGHIVLSTLHTNDAAGAFPRLIDMHIEPFLMTSSIHTIIAQRLTRKICQDCKEEVELDKVEVQEVQDEIAKMPKTVQEELRKQKLSFFQGKGCDVCGGKGYKGRIGVFEVLDVNEEARSLVLKRSSGTEITESAIKNGMITMIQDGIIKALRGQTTMSEVWRVTKE